jgi:hypothetical protein
MQHPDDTNPEPIKPDLKHDTMEFNAASEGDDVLDTDKETPLELEDESITAEELSSLEDDELEDQEAALQSAEEDSLQDEDNFINEPGRQNRRYSDKPRAFRMMTKNRKTSGLLDLCRFLQYLFTTINFL